MVGTEVRPESADTAFRRAERYYKARGPQSSNIAQRKKLAKRGAAIELPDLRSGGVLDLSRWTTSDDNVDSNYLAEGSERVRDDVARARWHTDVDKFGGRRDGVVAIKLHKLETTGTVDVTEYRGRIGWILGDGLILIPKYFSPTEQLSLLHSSLSDYTLPPNPLNLSTHYHLPSETDTSLFDLYCTESDALIPTISSRIAPTHGGSSLATEESPPSPASSTGTRREPIGNRPASEEGYEVILRKVKAWKGDEPSTRLKAKTAKALVEKELRWANLGWVYNWTNKAYDFTTTEPIPFPFDLRQKCVDLVRSVPWREVFPNATEGDSESRIIPDWQRWPDDYAPDTGIVNFYQTRDTLMGHVDRSELDPYRPLISISLGHAAIFLVGGSTRDVPPIPVVLRSGDALIMAGRARSFYHGVPRVMEGTLPRHFAPCEGDDATTRACKQYISTARININARQVFPAGFERPLD